MNKKVFWLSIIAVLASFAGGFLLANSLNKKEMSVLQAENERLKKAENDAALEDEAGTLSDDEIKRKIAEADANPSNIPFQKNLALALFNYASMKENAGLLREVSRLMTRVYEKNPEDYEAVAALGNINLALGYFEKNNENLLKARGFYQKALAKNADDADVRTDLGLTYLFSNPPENSRAVDELQKSLKINSENEKTLQALIQAFQNQNKKEDAEKYAAKLKEINPNNQILAEPDSPPENAQTDSQKK